MKKRISPVAIPADGKVLVATRVEEGDQLELLAERATLNGISVEMLDKKALQQVEPEARLATGKALFIRSTAVGSPKAVLQALRNEIEQTGVGILFNAKIVSVSGTQQAITLDNGTHVQYGHAINAAGLHADYIGALFVWLNFGQFSSHWLPYQNLIFQ